MLLQSHNPRVISQVCMSACMGSRCIGSLRPPAGGLSLAPPEQEAFDPLTAAELQQLEALLVRATGLDRSSNGEDFSPSSLDNLTDSELCKTQQIRPLVALRSFSALGCKASALCWVCSGLLQKYCFCLCSLSQVERQ